jgi:hypothetical protein
VPTQIADDDVVDLTRLHSPSESADLFLGQQRLSARRREP